MGIVCEECKQCENYMVCENGCFGSTKPCEQLLVTENNNPNNEPRPNYWGEY